MKIVIVGPGALGSFLAASFLKGKSASLKQENIFWLLDHNSQRAARLAKQGIDVEGVAGNWHVQANVTADAKSIGQADIVIICVKSYDTKEAIADAAPLFSGSTKVLTLQNGMGNIELISEAVTPERVIAAATNLGVELLEPGHLRYNGKGETILGNLQGELTVEMRWLRELFNKSGLDCRISRDIKSILWSKLVINSGINALSALVRLNNGKLIEYEGARRILREAATEAVRVARRKRIKLAYDDPLAKVEAVCEATAGNVSSMLQDVHKKKRTEIDFINGVIVRFGQELGIPVPVNALLVDLVKTIEAGYDVSTSS